MDRDVQYEVHKFRREQQYLTDRVARMEMLAEGDDSDDEWADYFWGDAAAEAESIQEEFFSDMRGPE